MPSGGRALVIGGGISAGAPFALDQFLYVTNVTQPTAASYAGLVRGTNAIEAPGTQATRAKRNTVIGSGSTITNVVTEDAVVIGSNNSVGTAATPTVAIICIGRGNTLPNTTTLIVIGGGTNDGGSTGTIKIGNNLGGLHNNATVIASSATLGGALNGVQIGDGSSTSGGGGGAVVIGSSAGGQTNVSVVGAGSAGHNQNCAVLGPGITITGGGGSNNIFVGSQMSNVATSNAISVGHGATIQTGVIAIGNCNLGALGYSGTVLWGGESTHVSGTAVPAWTVRYKGAAGANIAAGDVTVVGPLATGNAASGNIVFQTGLVGGAGSGAQVATNVCRLTNAQKFEIMQDNGLTFVGQTTGAAAQVGTLNNAPVAGNPAFWLRVVINGTNRFLPAW
jgi:hypothetical protein